MKTTPEHVARWRVNHQSALASLHVNPATADGLKMWRKLRRLEAEASAIALHYCNGTGGIHTENIEEKTAPIREKIRAVFGGKLPAGFRINYDARGYALKIDPERGTVPEGMQTDWGRNGLLAAEINPED